MENEIKELKKEQTSLSNSINELKKEQKLFNDKNKILEEEIEKKSQELKNNEAILAEAKINAGNAAEEGKLKEFELSKTITILENSNSKLLELRKNITDQQTIYDENKKFSDKQLLYLDEKQAIKIKDLNDEFKAYEEKTEKEKVFIQEQLSEIKKDSVILQEAIDELTDERDKLKLDIENLETKKAELDNIIQQGTETSVDLIGKTERIEQIIKENGITLGVINSELKKVREDFKNSEKELNKNLSKIGFIQKKEDSLKSFEAYIIEISNKYGLDYQPYEG